MAVFKVFKNFNLFVDGVSQAGKCNVALPNTQSRTEEHNAGGLDGPIVVDLGIQAITFTWTMFEYDRQMLSLSFAGDSRNVGVTFRGVQEDTNGVLEPVKIEARGWVSGTDNGSAEGGARPSVQFTFNARYINLEIGGQEVWEIDPINMVRRIGGVDILEQQRNAIGI
jgi:P2 family phage contractile tail tube protein